MKFFAMLRRRLSGKSLEREIRFDEIGFSVAPACEPPIVVPWAAVQEVCGYKRDLFSYDEICLGFRLENGAFVQSGELDHNFKTFQIEVERRFDLDPAWFGKVGWPAFEENLTLLWRRDRPTAHDAEKQPNHDKREGGQAANTD